VTDTRTPGYLAPRAEPLGQTALEDTLQAVVAGVTGLAPQLVRPRWQPKPPTAPDRAVTWCAVGVTDMLPGVSSVSHSGAGDGTGVVTAWWPLTLLTTFYGPQAQAQALRLAAGLTLGQNRVALRDAGLALTSVGAPRLAPELRDGIWLPRVDLEITLTWETRAEYGVCNLTAATGEIVTDTGGHRTLEEA
jgi:hypothetical protein